MATNPLPLTADEILAGEPAESRAALGAVWAALGDLAPDPSEAPDAAWEALRARLGAPADAPPEARRRAPDRAPAARPRRRRAAAVLLAAVLFVAVGTVGGVLTWRGGTVEHVAAAGETREIVLPDGSRVTLNSGASLHHTRAFAPRDVALAGEAFFDVAHDAAAPFRVATGTARIEVLGTGFNVRAYGTSTEVALVRGRVRVVAASGRAPGQAVPGEAVPSEATLEPGEAVSVGAAQVSAPAATDVERIASWRRGALAFADLPLGDVLAEISRRYGVAFETAPAAPVGARVSAYYTARPGIEALLGDIGAAAGVRFTPSARGYTVRPAR